MPKKKGVNFRYFGWWLEKKRWKYHDNTIEKNANSDTKAKLRFTYTYDGEEGNRLTAYWRKQLIHREIINLNFTKNGGTE